MITEFGKDYYQDVFQQYIELQLKEVTRVDVVWNRYLPNSLKQSTRQRRTQNQSTQRQRVDDNSPIPSNWESFLRSEQNKDELFSYLAKCMQSYHCNGKVLISTLGKLVVTTGQMICKIWNFCSPAHMRRLIQGFFSIF